MPLPGVAAPVSLSVRGSAARRAMAAVVSVRVRTMVACLMPGR